MDQLIERVEKFVYSLYKDYVGANLVYHNYEHTENVVEYIFEIIQNEIIPDRDRQILLTAGWFHDTGQLFAPGKGHEEESVKIMYGFFEGKDIVDTDFCDKVSVCIRATKMPVHPTNLNEKIICDADTFHLGTALFRNAYNKIKREQEAMSGVKDEEWDIHTLAFLESHRFYTTYCKTNLEDGKQANILELRSRIDSAIT